MSTLSLVILFIAGLLLGSFLSAVIYRIHYNKPGLFTGFSICPKCNKQLGPQDLVPLFSYLIQGGKCRHCKKHISWHYPVLELSTGLLFVAMGTAGLAPLGLYLFFGLILVFIFFYDLLYLEIPDEIMIPSIVIALLATFHPETISFLNGFYGAAVVVLFFLLQIIISRGKWLGGGDLRIGAFIGFILGFKLTIVAVFLSYVIGSIISVFLLITGRAKGKTMIAFGPFLVLGTLITIFYGDFLVEWYLDLTNLSL
ncbi:MAG: prepilin peptidase [Candidatus Peregrinibacteria bacterium]|nr:prepilin peptidase [Candidatus Peregrinibacteria bacterium]